MIKGQSYGGSTAGNGKEGQLPKEHGTPIRQDDKLANATRRGGK